MSRQNQPEHSPKVNRKTLLGTRFGPSMNSPTAVVDLYPVVQAIDEPPCLSSSCCLFSGSLYDSWEELFPSSRDVMDSPRDDRPGVPQLPAQRELPHLPDISSSPHDSAPILKRNTSQESKSSRRSDRTAEESTSSESGGQLRFQDSYVLTRQIFRSSVWECVHRVSGRRYCAKLCTSSNEIRMFRCAQGNNHIVRLQETLPTTKMRQYMVMEYIDGGNLLSAIVQKGRLSEDRIRWIARQLSQALLHLHTVADMTHNDICPANVLLQEQGGRWVVKLADFGASRSASHPSRGSILPSGWHQAPERRPSPASDMWSVGALVLFCWHGNAEFSLQSPYGGLSRPCKQFLTQILSPDPEVRLTAQEALDHAWMEGPRSPRETPEVVMRGRPRWRELWVCWKTNRDQSSNENSTLDSIGGFS